MCKLLISVLLSLVSVGAIAQERFRYFYKVNIDFSSLYTHVSAGSKPMGGLKGFLVYSDDFALCEMELKPEHGPTKVYPCESGKDYIVVSKVALLDFTRNMTNEKQPLSIPFNEQINIAFGLNYRNKPFSKVYQVHTPNIRESYYITVSSTEAVPL